MKFDQLVPSAFYVNLKDALPLFCDCLEFQMMHEDFHAEQPFYVLKKDDLGVLLFQNAEYAGKVYPEFRLVTKNIEEVFQKVSATHPHLLHPNLKQVTLRPWGAREFAIKDDQVCFIIQQW
jgi:hypothetical protein